MNLNQLLRISYIIFFLINFNSVCSQNFWITDYAHDMVGLKKYHEMGYTGKGVTIAVLDNGFYRVDSIAAFAKLRDRGGIIATFDVIANDSNVFDRGNHGLYVLSIMAGFVNDSFNGSAPNADYILVHTENALKEVHQEEYNWKTGSEWAIEKGADIINSSLGYSLFDTLEGDYSYQEMNGKSTVVTLAAEAASKQVLVVNSAGNNGNNSWYHITAPCDGPSVFCIGALDSFGRVAVFSSRGPTADGRIKPNVSAMGANVAFINSRGRFQIGSGTSFSSPLIAGMMACLKQAFPNASNELLMRSVEQSASHYNNPNEAIGYGIPNVLLADSIIKSTLASITNNSKTSTPFIFPNPSKNKLFVEHNYPIFLLELKNVLGEIIMFSHENKLDITMLPKGQYFLHITDSRQNFWVKKIQK
ncbi:MAG: hypothetical protein CBB99_05180 [Bacteroidetes bacterium TMED39]|nr:MAG: hypothetical protein CBB99_05180 [Bacteroidetes bacterium TMED39]